MNKMELTELKKLIIHVASYYGRDLLPETITMMASDLEDFDLSAVKSAYEKYRREDKTMKFPMPIIIRWMLQPVADTDSLAQEAAARVVEAVRKFGWPHPTEAKNWIGSLGWRAVERFGGWQYICENLGLSLSQSTFFAQVRDLSRATIKLGEAGFGDQPIQIPGGQRIGIEAPSGDLTPVADIMKLLPKGNN